MPVSKPDSALLILGHGSTADPDSSRPCWDHAEAIARAGNFGSVHCAFWKEEPSVRQVWPMIEESEVYVVPNFISEGYFTREVLPRELELEGHTTQRGRHLVHYCDPVGIHSGMTDLLIKRAREMMGDSGDPSDAALLIVGHGTNLNRNSKEAARKQVEAIREASESSGIQFAEVLEAYMEEEPCIAGWESMTNCKTVIIVPFFIADALHSNQDIPALVGIETSAGAAGQEDSFRERPHRFGDRTLYYSSAIGTDPSLAEVILDQVASFDENYAS